LSKLETSKSEIRRIINNNGVKINNAIVNDNKFLIKNNLFNNEKTLKLSLGKKRHVKVELT
jgi:tyrosyl-tRNA synthetase